MRLKVGETYMIFSEKEPVFYYHYPFATDKLTVPVRIEAEYPKWFLGTVLPHFNPRGYGPSRPYRITITKNDINIGWVKVLRRAESGVAS